jgi:WD40 repeat protein
VGLQVAEALDYAHRQGVLHRDIKPSNLILDTAGTVWVTDFGLAKHEGDDFTHTGDVVGTLRYMSPERLQGRSDARSDLYSLGLSLYELCTLRPAFGTSDRVTLLRQIEKEAPPTPRQCEPRIPRDLETIILKSIDKLPSHRYRSAAEMAEDLQLFLSDRPILARRITWRERAWRWCRRNPVPAMLTSCVAVLLLLLVVGSLVFAAFSRRQARLLADQTLRALDAEQQAVGAKQEAIHRLYDSCLGQARAGRWSTRPGQHYRTLASLTQAAEILPTLGLEPGELLARKLVLRNEAIAAMPLIDLREARRWTLADGWTATVAFTPDYSQYAQSDVDGNVIVRRVVDDSRVVGFRGPGQRAWILMFSPDGRFLAGRFHRGGPRPTPPVIHVWDLSTNKLVFIEDSGRVQAGMAFRPDGRQVALGSDDRQVRLYDLPAGELAASRGFRQAPFDVCYAPTGDRLAVAFRGTAAVEIWSQTTDDSQAAPAPGHVSALTWSPDGQMLALGTASGKIQLQQVDQIGPPVRKFDGHTQRVVQLTFNHRGDLLASRAWDGTCRLWQVATGLHALRVEASLPVHVGFREDDRQLAFATHESGFGIWDVSLGGPLTILPGRPEVGQRWSLDFHPKETQLLASATHSGVELWDVDAKRLERVLAAPYAKSAAFAPDGQSLLTSSNRGLQRWPLQPLETAEPRPIRVGQPEAILPPAAERFDLGAGGRLLAVDRGSTTASVLELGRSGQPRDIAEHRNLDHVVISPDGRWIVTTTWKGLGIRVWNVAKGELVRDLAPDVGSATPGFSPDGRWLAASDGHAHYIWSVANWQCVHTIPRDHPDGWPGPVAFSPDSRMLAIPHSRYVAQLIEPHSGATLAVLEPPISTSLSAYRFSPDGRFLAVAETENIQLWDLPAIGRRLAEMDIDCGLSGPFRK